MCVPSGITDGSTATTPQPTGRPLEVYPGEGVGGGRDGEGGAGEWQHAMTGSTRAGRTTAACACAVTCARRCAVMRCSSASEETYAARAARVRLSDATAASASARAAASADGACGEFAAAGEEMNVGVLELVDDRVVVQSRCVQVVDVRHRVVELRAPSTTRWGRPFPARRDTRTCRATRACAMRMLRCATTSPCASAARCARSAAWRCSSAIDRPCATRSPRSSD